MNPRNVWPAVALAGIGAVVACVMAIARVDTTVIVTVLSLLITPVLGALILGQVAELKSTSQHQLQQTNGNTTRMLDILEGQSQLLAAATPAAEPPSDARHAA
jgi:ABC-type transport system involved in cytochrome bd biosynthesis fused ATPase/permease subunit